MDPRSWTLSEFKRLPHEWMLALLRDEIPSASTPTCSPKWKAVSLEFRCLLTPE